MTDVLGICTRWADGVAVVEQADGRSVAIPVGSIVAGKPVPPRPSVRMRVTPDEAQRRAMALWPDLETEPLGAWVLRWSPTSTNRRANSVLAMGPAETADPVPAVTSRYRALGRRPVAQVLPGSAEEAEFLGRGWVPESADADSLFQLAGITAARRALASRPSVAVQVTGDATQVRARIGDDASGLASLTGDWLGLRALEVAAGQRRRGLGLAVVAALLDWGAEQGAGTAYLQVLGDNDAALGLYGRLGFRTHHSYRYLAAPDLTV